MDYNENPNHHDGYSNQSENDRFHYDQQDPYHQNPNEPPFYQQGNPYEQNPNEPPFYRQGNPYQQNPNVPPYGQGPYYQQNRPYQVPARDPGYGMAVASMVLGIVSFFIASLITGCLGIIFGAVAKSKGSRSPMATAGIVCGVISVILGIVLIIINRSLFFYFADVF